MILIRIDYKSENSRNCLTVPAGYFFIGMMDYNNKKGSFMAKITQYSAKNLIPEAGVDPEKWNRIPSPDIVEKTVQEIEKRGIKVIPAADGEEALSLLKNHHPAGG